MNTWKLVSGILSIILSAFVVYQSGAAGILNTVEGNGEVSGSAGILVAVLLLAGGIVSIVSRKGGKGKDIIRKTEDKGREKEPWMQMFCCSLTAIWMRCLSMRH